jgi:SAM-dependent methyltransferase
MVVAVRDFFSTQAADYAAHRPHYPAALFTALAALAPDYTLAWDCATGNGQAAVALADHFDHVIATDVSAEQIARAEPHERVQYRVARAEESGLASASVSLVNVAQALHWFELDRFFAEVRRVLNTGGILAVSSYDTASLDTPELTRAFQDFELVTLADYWPPERNFVGDGLRTLPFPFPDIPVPEFPMAMQWTLDDVLGYARSWSASGVYVRRHGSDPIRELAALLRPLWGPPERRRTIRWPLVVRAGRM